MTRLFQSTALRGIPSGVWALGFVSMFMDVSSEMIHALLPVYLVTALGASMSEVGLIEGMAEATSSIVKIFSGALSDWLGRRKLLAAAGYGLAAFAKPIFPLASSLHWIVAARFIDRVGKGIRGAPRDALVADLSPPGLRGASFGLRQSLDTVGAFVGPLLAILLMWSARDSIRSVFWLAVLPAFISFALILSAVHDPARDPASGKAKAPLRLPDLRKLASDYWWVVALASVFTLARFSEAFLVLRAQGEGLPVMFVPTILVVMNVVYALAAFPAGILSDRAGRLKVLIMGLVVLVVADLCLAALPSITGAVLGAMLWGLHMGLTQGVLSSLVADHSPPDLRGSAFGAFNLVTGLVMFAASLIAGAMWDATGPSGTFFLGAAFAACALLGTVLLDRRTSTRAHAAD